jgi:hypothetical protein
LDSFSLKEIPARQNHGTRFERRRGAAGRPFEARKLDGEAHAVFGFFNRALGEPNDEERGES